MTSSVTRRDFLQRSSCVLAGTAAAAMFGRRLPAAESRVPFPLACGDATLRHVQATDCWAALKAIGAEGVEANISLDLSFPRLFHPTRKYSAATPDDVATLKGDMQASGCKITAFLMSNQFDVRPEQEVTWVIQAAQAAQALGVPAIRIDVVNRKPDAGNFLQGTIETLKRIIAGSESTGVVFGVENHGRTTNDPEFLDALFAGVGSPRLGLTLDTGNFYWFGHPLSKLYDLYAKYARRVFHTHCKSIKYPADQRDVQRPMGWKYGEFNCPIDQGDIDFRRVVKILRDAGYRYDLCIENESLGKLPEADRAAALAKEIQYLKQCAEA
ncbi:MAG: sugar phosphate isomerase/epimerase [Candidatus Anammoximicrobium sp.]|nr:sugar phosphate isomerase/epimerase [Candidatus Anammoximicrobium sp.]